MPGIDSSNSDNMVWPSPPEVPRYAFIGHLYGESNTAKIDQNGSLLSRFFTAVGGWDEEKSTLAYKVISQLSQYAPDLKSLVFDH